MPSTDVLGPDLFDVLEEPTVDRARRCLSAWLERLLRGPPRRQRAPSASVEALIGRYETLRSGCPLDRRGRHRRLLRALHRGARRGRSSTRPDLGLFIDNVAPWTRSRTSSTGRPTRSAGRPTPLLRSGPSPRRPWPWRPTTSTSTGTRSPGRRRDPGVVDAIREGWPSHLAPVRRATSTACRTSWPWLGGIGLHEAVETWPAFLGDRVCFPSSRSPTVWPCSRVPEEAAAASSSLPTWKRLGLRGPAAGPTA